jgi:hypothetical protein
MTESPSRRHGPFDDSQLRIVPANQAAWPDLVAVFGTADYPAHCLCQRFKTTGWIWRETTVEQRQSDRLLLAPGPSSDGANRP